jgi:hypothetical protein
MQMEKTTLKNVNSAKQLSFIIDCPPDMRHKEPATVLHYIDFLLKKGELYQLCSGSK